MRTIKGCFILSVLTVIALSMTAGVGYSQISAGQTAPLFSLKDLKGQAYDLSQMKTQPMVILYFFDVDSKASQEGLLSLNQLAKQHKETDLTVWAITLSPQGKITSFVTRTDLGFPILIDGAKVSDLYQARQILPTVCILGPALKVLDCIQGGGKATEMMLTRLAERELQRKQTKIAKVLSDEVIKKNPQNVKAMATKGYAALKEGNLKEAEETFKDLSQQGPQGEVLGKEGLSAVYAKQEQPKKVFQLAKEVEEKAPDRAYVHMVKGDVLYGQGKKNEAEAEYRKATEKKTAEPYQEAVRYNQLGRFYTSSGQYQKAQALYDQAVAIDPYYIEGTTNKGLLYEKEGKWDKALESYRQALAFEKNDTFALILAKKAQEILDLQKDVERKKRMDQLIKDLAARYQAQKESRKKAEDAWTSQPMILSFVDFQEKGGLAERDGFSSVLMTQLGDLLNSSGRVRVVERVLIERLLEELNLGSSDLANPETALRLGRVLAARLIGSGSLFYLPKGTLLSMRLIDVETTVLTQAMTKQFGSQASLEKEIFQLNREILKTVIEKYPLRGFLVKVTGNEVMLNIGSKQGVVSGTKFDVVEEQESVKYKGKVLSAAPKSIAKIEVARVEPDLCFAKILTKERTLKADDKAQETVDEMALR